LDSSGEETGLGADLASGKLLNIRSLRLDTAVVVERSCSMVPVGHTSMHRPQAMQAPRSKVSDACVSEPVTVMAEVGQMVWQALQLVPEQGLLVTVGSPMQALSKGGHILEEVATPC
jgi:hypothetical protein